MTSNTLARNAKGYVEDGDVRDNNLQEEDVRVNNVQDEDVRAGSPAWEDVNQCAVAAQAGDTQAVRQLCTEFRPLIRTVARIYQGVSYEDALQEGYLAFLRAIRDFDATRGIPFVGFAARRVHGDVRTAMRREWRTAERVVLTREVAEESPGKTPSVWDRVSLERWLQNGRRDEFSTVEWRDLLVWARLTTRESLAIALHLEG